EGSDQRVLGAGGLSRGRAMIVELHMRSFFSSVPCGVPVSFVWRPMLRFGACRAGALLLILKLDRSPAGRPIMGRSSSSFRSSCKQTVLCDEICCEAGGGINNY
ncbi:MAG: hypothetical protein ACK56F_18130, partial [bacterium]